MADLNWYWRCPLCGLDRLVRPFQPHHCNGQFRKRFGNVRFEPVNGVYPTSGIALSDLIDMQVISAEVVAQRIREIEIAQ